MNYSKYRISLDIHDTNSQAMLNVKKDDTARKIYFSLTDGGRPYQIAEGCTAVFRAKKPDGTILYNNCTINDNVIDYTLTQQTSASVGIVECELTLYGLDSRQITSPRFTLIIEDNLYSESEVESTNEFTELTAAIAEVGNLDASVSKADGVATITVTKKDGTTVTASVSDGEKGEKGDKGEQGEKGDINGSKATFTAAITRENIESGETSATLFGKIKKWFADLGALAFKSTVEKTDLADAVQTSLGKADTAAKLAPENPDGIQPYNIPMGYPGGDGSLFDSGLQISDVVRNSSFNNNDDKFVKVEKYTETDGRDGYHLVASSLSTDDIPTKQNLVEQVHAAVNKAGVVTTEGFTNYGGYLVVTSGPDQLQSQPIGIWDVALVENMELLNETTLTEDAVVMFNTDSSGNALALTKFELLVSLPAVTAATMIWVGINGNCVAYTQASSASATNPTYRIWGEYIPAKNNWYFQSVMNPSTGAASGTIFAFPNGNRYTGTLPSSAGGVIIATNAALTNALPTGTKVTLWGVRE